MPDERFTEAVRTKNAMTALVASEGWEMLDGVLREREANLLADFTDGSKDLSEGQLREFRIGLNLIRGIRMTPQTMLEVAEETIEELAREEEQQPEQEQDDGEEEDDLSP